MQWFVYLLRCRDKSYYVGSTNDLPERLRRHRSGQGATWTSSRLPVTLVYQETHPTQGEAIGRERQIKRWSRAKKEALITGGLVALKRHSKCRHIASARRAEE